MQRKVIVITSKSNMGYCRKFYRGEICYNADTFLAFSCPPDYTVIGIGGGAVIDKAKICANPNPCIAIPTTASGSAVTPFATEWQADKKTSISVPAPVCVIDRSMRIRLNRISWLATVYDALCHAIESYWSTNVTFGSRIYSELAMIKIIKQLKYKGNIFDLIEAGNMAGRAIAITKTNVIHAHSYGLTVFYNIPHGLACGMLLPRFLRNYHKNDIAQLCGFDNNEDLIMFLKIQFNYHCPINIDWDMINEHAKTYDKVNDWITA